MSSNEYMARYMLARYYRRRAKAVEQLGGKCVWCGSDDNLHIDHIDPTTKKYRLGKRISSLAKAKLARELEKCQLLCAECHREKSSQELHISRPITHNQYTTGP